MFTLPQLTPEAWAFVLRPVTGEGRVLVVGRRKHGCAGWSYTLTRGTQPPKDALTQTIILADGEARIAVMPADVAHLHGSQARLTRSDFGQQLVWDNPQEMDRCGCGLSVLTAPAETT